MVDRRNGPLDRAALVKLDVGERVHDRIALKMLRDERLGRQIAVQMLGARLVGDVEPALFVHAQRLQLAQQRGQIRVYERAVGLAVRRRIPAEYAPVFAVHRRHDLGRGVSTPLREEVGDLIVLHAAALGHVHPAAQLVKAEGVNAVIDVNIHQLHGQALRAHAGVQRRGVRGHHDHVDAPLHGGAHEVLGDAPMLLGEHRHMVIVAQAVVMEPFCVDERLMRQAAGQYAHDLRAPDRLVLGLVCGQLDGDRVVARLHRAVRLHVDPQRVPLAAARAQIVRADLLKHVGIQSGLLAQIVVAAVLKAGETHRHMADAAHMDMRLDGRIHAAGHIDRAVRIRSIGRLKGDRFVLKAGQPSILGALDGFLVQKHLLQRADQFELQNTHGDKSSAILSSVKPGATCRPSSLFYIDFPFLSTRARPAKAQKNRRVRRRPDCRKTPGEFERIGALSSF